MFDCVEDIPDTLRVSGGYKVVIEIVDLVPFNLTLEQVDKKTLDIFQFVGITLQ